MEWTAPRFQALGVTTTIGAASVGQLLLGGMAFAIRDWHTLQLVYSLPLFVLFLSSRYQPPLFLRRKDPGVRAPGIRTQSALLSSVSTWARALPVWALCTIPGPGQAGLPGKPRTRSETCISKREKKKEVNFREATFLLVEHPKHGMGHASSNHDALFICNFY